MDDSAEDLLSEFEAKGEAAVRQALILGWHSDEYRRLARQWLSAREGAGSTAKRQRPRRPVPKRNVPDHPAPPRR